MSGLDLQRPQFDVVAVEFHNRSRMLEQWHRIAVTFRDGHVELTDVRASACEGVAAIFAAAIPEAIAKRRTGIALQAQYERLRSQWFAQLDCTHRETVPVKPEPLNAFATTKCVHCGALKGGVGWRHVLDLVGQVRQPYTADDIESVTRNPLPRTVSDPLGDGFAISAVMKDGRAINTTLTEWKVDHRRDLQSFVIEAVLKAANGGTQ